MNTKKTFGTWMWDINSINKSTEAIGFLKSRNVTEVYLAYNPKTSHKNYREFVKNAYQNDIRVSLIGADAYWILERGVNDFDTFLDWFHRYQSGCSNIDEKFYGIHLDIEPHQLDEWSVDLNNTIKLYMNLILKAEKACRDEGVLLEADIPFWFDQFKVIENNEKIALCEFCIRHCDTTLLMSYRDNARDVFECGRFELGLSEKYGKKVSLALETGKVYEEVNITFFHLGTKALDKELKLLDKIVSEESSPYEIGYAVHYYECWSTLPENGHPEGPDYPFSK